MADYNIDLIMHHKAQAEKHGAAGNKSSYHEHMYGVHNESSKYHQLMANKATDRKEKENHTNLVGQHKTKAAEHFGYYMNADRKINESIIGYKAFISRKV